MFTGAPLGIGILITGVVTLVYRTVGGLWADALTDFGRFVIQNVAALSMVIIALDQVGGAFLSRRPTPTAFEQLRAELRPDLTAPGPAAIALP